VVVATTEVEDARVVDRFGSGWLRGWVAPAHPAARRFEEAEPALVTDHKASIIDGAQVVGEALGWGAPEQLRGRDIRGNPNDSERGIVLAGWDLGDARVSQLQVLAVLEL
jgi:hypothetical protein